MSAFPRRDGVEDDLLRDGADRQLDREAVAERRSVDDLGRGGDDVFDPIGGDRPPETPREDVVDERFGRITTEEPPEREPPPEEAGSRGTAA